MRKLIIGLLAIAALVFPGAALAKQQWTTYGPYPMPNGCNDSPVSNGLPGLGVPLLDSWNNPADSGEVTFVTNGTQDQIGQDTTTYVKIHCTWQGPPRAKSLSLTGFECGASFGTRSANFASHDSTFSYPRTGRDVTMTCKGQLGVFS